MHRKAEVRGHRDTSTGQFAVRSAPGAVETVFGRRARGASATSAGASDDGLDMASEGPARAPSDDEDVGVLGGAHAQFSDAGAAAAGAPGSVLDDEDMWREAELEEDEGDADEDYDDLIPPAGDGGGIGVPDSDGERVLLGTEWREGLLACARAVLVVGDSDVERVHFSSRRGAVRSIWARSMSLSNELQRRVLSGTLGDRIPHGWKTVLSSSDRQAAFFKVLSLVFGAWVFVASSSRGVRVAMRIGLVARDLFRIAPSAPNPPSSPKVLAQDLQALAFLVGLGGRTETRDVVVGLLDTRAAGGASSVHSGVLDPVVGAAAAALSMEDTGSVQMMASGPFLAFATTRDRALGGVDLGDFASMLDAVPQTAFAEYARAVGTVEGMGDVVVGVTSLLQKGGRLWGFLPGAASGDDGRAVDAAMTSAMLEYRGTEAHAVDPVDVGMLRVSAAVLPSEFIADGHWRRWIIECSGTDRAWVLLESVLSPGEVELVRRGGVSVDGKLYCVRVAARYEDSLEAWSAHLSVCHVRDSLRERGIASLMFPIMMGQDGVLTTAGGDGSTTPVMVATICGRPGRFWSARNVAFCGFSAKEKAGIDGNASFGASVDNGRLHHAVLRAAIAWVGEDLSAVLSCRPPVIIKDKDSDAILVPIPYVAGLLVDQPEHAALSSTRQLGTAHGRDCGKCWETHYLSEWHDLVQAAVKATEDPGVGVHVVHAAEACRSADRTERAVFAGDDHGERAAVAHKLKTVMPIDAFASSVSVGPPQSGHTDDDAPLGPLDVTLHNPTDPSSCGAQLYVPDGLHLFKLAMQHSLDLFDRAVLSPAKTLSSRLTILWDRCAVSVGIGGSSTTAGLCGLHRRSIVQAPSTASEPQAFAHFLRFCLLATWLLEPTGDDESADTDSAHKLTGRRLLHDVLLPLARAILLYYPPHHRASAAVQTLPRTMLVTYLLLSFSTSYATHHRETLRAPPHYKVDLSHHNLTHCPSSWLRFGSSALCSMSAFEHTHARTRQAAAGTSLQTIATDASSPSRLASSAHAVSLALRIAPGDEAAEVSRGIAVCSDDAGVASRRTKHVNMPRSRRSEAAPMPISAASEAFFSAPLYAELIAGLFRASVDARRDPISDDGSARLLPESADSESLDTVVRDVARHARVVPRVVLPLHSYCLQVRPLNGEQRLDVANAVFLHALCSTGRGDGPPGFGVAPLLLCWCVSCELAVGPGRTTRVTLLFGHIPERVDSPLRPWVQAFRVPEPVQPNAVCFLRDVGVVLGAVWNRYNNSLRSVGAVHPAIVALRRSLLRVDGADADRGAGGASDDDDETDASDEPEAARDGDDEEE
jgi:hypothetical protein